MIVRRRFNVVISSLDGVPQPSTELGNFLCLSAHGAAEAPRIRYKRTKLKHGDDELHAMYVRTLVELTQILPFSGYGDM